jgi:hypothetical protein
LITHSKGYIVAGYDDERKWTNRARFGVVVMAALDASPDYWTFLLFGGKALGVVDVGDVVVDLAWKKKDIQVLL